MRRVLFAAVVGLWAAIAFAQPTATLTRTENLRPTSSSARTPIRQVMTGETVTLINTRTVNGHYHVLTTQGERGWLYRTASRSRRR